MITGLDHVQLLMPPGEGEKARSFWGALLGLEEVPRPPALASRGGVWFALPDGKQLHVSVQEDFQPSRRAHPALLSEALDDLAGALSAAGYPVNWDTRLDPLRRFYSADPFGNRVEFLEAE